MSEAAADRGVDPKGIRQVTLDRIGLVTAAILCWALAAWAVGDPLTLAGPLDTGLEIWRQFGSTKFWKNTASTATAVAQAGTISLMGGVGLGVLIGTNRIAAAVLEPILVSLYSLPKVTFFPVILLVFGLGMSSKVALGVFHGIVPVMLFTVGAIRATPAIYGRAGRAMGLTGLQQARYVTLPAILPEVLTGMRIGLSLTLLGVLVGELFAARSGLGTQLRKAMELADGQEIMALALILFIASLVLNGAFITLARRFGGGQVHER